MKKSLRNNLYEIIFEADTPLGKAFDVALLIAILISVVAVMLESVDDINQRYGYFLRSLEWFFTILFTIEYIIRIVTSKKPLSYIFSFYGFIDLLSILPTFLSLVVVGTQSLLIIRTVRLLRVFRILKLAQFVGQGRHLIAALKASRAKITVFLVAVLTMVTILGTLMYLIEGEEGGFSSIPKSIYWAIVTLTTVGYGDLAPQTSIGQAFASIVMILGYAVIAVPTGIITVELSKVSRMSVNTQVCSNCGYNQHDDDAKFCKICGEPV